MKQKRRYKRYLEDKYEQRSRSQKYRNPPSSISNYGSSTPNATVPDQNDSCGSKLNDSDNATCDDCNESEACISQQNDLPIVLPNQDQSLLGEESVWCSASDMSSTHSANSDRGEVRLGGAQDELFNGHWDRDAHEQIMTASECENGDNDSHAEGDELNVAGNDRLGGFPRLRSFIAKNENNEIKHACMDVNNCEIVLAVLKYALTYSLSQTAVADLFKLICVLLGCDDLPSSRYLLDKLFNNTEGVVYHACCPECKKYVSTFDQTTKRVTCSYCNFVIDVRSPTYNEFFAIIDPRFELANLLESNWEEYQKTLRKDTPRGIYSDFTDGDMYRELVDSLPLEIRFKFITLLFNADGAALYKSSNHSIWPIQAIINELPYRVRTASPVTCGIWFGKDKPEMQIFLKEFVLCMNKLSDEGVPCQIGETIEHIRVFCPCGCVDSMARGPMQGMKLCTGYFGCNWCLHPGLYVTPGPGKKGAVKYVCLDGIADRTEAETKEHMREAAASTEDVCGLKCASWLINLFCFNIIWGFVPDSMHHVDLGLGKQFLERWLTVLTPSERGKIDSFMKKIKVPNNIQRLSRPIKDRKFWKAQEWENFILYYSLPILRSFPHMSQIADHWSLLVEGYYMLMKDTVTRNNVFSAHEVFKEFVVKTQAIYSKEFMTFNLHQLLHLAQSVLNWGPLWSHSGYAFESNNANYLKQIHSPKGVTRQVCRSVSMRQSEVILRRHVASMDSSSVTDYINYLEYSDAKKTTKLTNERYFGYYRVPSRRNRDRMNLSQNARIYRKMVKAGCLYRSMHAKSVRSDDSYAQLYDGSFIHIVEFLVDENLDRSTTVCKPLQVRPVMGRNLPTVIIVCENNEDAYINTSNIRTVCVAVRIDDVVYLTPPPNLYRN